MTETDKTVTVGRLETGAVQDRDDWPGVFIRGDNALMMFAPVLDMVLSGEPLPPIYRPMLQQLADLLKSCAAFQDGPTVVQHVIKQAGPTS